MGQTNSLGLPSLHDASVYDNVQEPLVINSNGQYECSNAFFSNETNFLTCTGSLCIERAQPHQPVNKKLLGLQDVKLRSCRMAGWRTSFDLQQESFLHQVTNHVHQFETDKTQDYLYLYLISCKLKFLIASSKTQSGKEAKFLREWVTFFISPLVTLETILETVIPFYDAKQAKCHRHLHSSQQLFKWIATWMHNVFPFIATPLVYSELYYLENFIKVSGSNLTISEVFFKRQLPVFLETELQSCDAVYQQLNTLDNFIVTRLFEIRNQIKNCYVTIMSKRFLIQEADEIYLSETQLCEIFNTTSKGTDIIKYLRYLEFPCRMVATKYYNIPDNLNLPYPKLNLLDKSHKKEDSVFPIPPLPNLTRCCQKDTINKKIVDVFLHRCSVDKSFLNTIVYEFNQDNSKKLCNLNELIFPSWLTPSDDPLKKNITSSNPINRNMSFEKEKHKIRLLRNNTFPK